MTKHMNPAKARGIMAVRADASSLPAIIAALGKDFSEFKATLVEKDKEIAAKFDDVVTTEKLNKINASVAELQATVDQANAKLAAQAMGGADRPLKDEEYSTAFKAHFKRGDVQAALNKGADAEGGYLAPVEWDRTIIDRLVEVSPMRQISAQQTISNNGFKKLVSLGGTGSGWVGESAGRPQTGTGQFGAVDFTTGELYANPAATQQMLDDSAVDLEAWLANEVETEFSLQEGLAFVAGDGVNKPRGFLTYATGGSAAAVHPKGAIPVLTAASATVITEDKLIDMIYSLPQVYTANARFVANRTSIGTVRKMRDADGRQLWQPSTAAGEPSTLLNYPVTEMPGMPDMEAGALPIAFGDFERGYLVVDRTGVRVLRDPYTNKPYVMFYTTKRVGGGVLDPKCLRILKMAAV